jgi:hypothetical protein
MVLLRGRMSESVSATRGIPSPRCCGERVRVRGSFHPQVQQTTRGLSAAAKLGDLSPRKMRGEVKSARSG